MLLVQNLVKHYHKEIALDGVSMEINEGEFVAILGSSGAGKSTFIRCINRLLEPTSGSIIYKGMDMGQLRKKQLREIRREMGMIFQDFHLISRFNTLQNVLVGSYGRYPVWRILLNRLPRKEWKLAEELISKVGMAPFAKKQVRDLSGGQRQRVGIARTLMQYPSIILGDEPVASLDPVTSRAIMDLLKEINEKDRITMIINLHDTEIARRYATRIIGLAKGRIVFDGQPDALTEEQILRIYGEAG
ncbi:phosphonate ABC transporter ATP-binding protein [Microaerobacter geothermalis]|uniref:phosphonate ABC transporter ATP-binding protein n=1 Tax=Microaerobacter geothermalis TaxID=674972 RepID=UPI001F32405F|nr:phosphonate ABC transporter ATP-binding protein [Microaerobacter geothermalis]MCF6094300.1 phosphonate ABC transporter ATP-binding protein [Microaerobacter geothermalis]